jgi:hypothetical protein
MESEMQGQRMPHPPARRYWALKTTAGTGGESFWREFRQEGVVAVGWRCLRVDPSSVTNDELREAIRRDCPDEKKPSRVAQKIRNFIDLNLDDLVLVCSGYSWNSGNVYIYGVARITGPFFYDHSSAWPWKSKHRAVIQVIEKHMHRSIIAHALNRDSLMETIHELEADRFTALVNALHQNLGVDVTM